MKKSLLILALTALMIPAFVSCSKDSKDEKKPVAPSFEPAKYQEEALKLTLVQGQQGSDPTPVSDIHSIEFTESGLYLVKKLEKTKADENYIYITGTYTVNGKTYVMNGFGSVTIEGEGESVSVTITQVDQETGKEETVEVTATSETAAEQNDVYRTWKVDELYIKVTGGNLDKAGVSKTFKGCDLKEISQYLKENKVNFDDADLEKYNVKDITISGCGTFMIQFTAADPYIGESDVNSGKFSYDFSASNGGNKIINAKGDGSIEFYMNKQNQERCALTLNGTISGNSTTYDSKIEFRLKAAE